jgi:hypothetical protein
VCHSAALCKPISRPPGRVRDVSGPLREFCSPDFARHGLNVLLAGAGPVGCELIKNLALMVWREQCAHPPNDRLPVHPHSRPPRLQRHCAACSQRQSLGSRDAMQAAVPVMAGHTRPSLPPTCALHQGVASNGGVLHCVAHDRVELWNLRRDFLLPQHRVGSPKAEVACAEASTLHPGVRTRPVDAVSGR